MVFCFLAAVAVLCGSVAAAWLLRKQKKEGRQTLPPLNVLFGGVLVAAVLLFLPAYTNQEMNDAFQVIKALAFSLYSAIRLFAADGDYEVILENIEQTHHRTAHRSSGLHPACRCHSCW